MESLGATENCYQNCRLWTCILRSIAGSGRSIEDFRNNEEDFRNLLAGEDELNTVNLSEMGNVFMRTILNYVEYAEWCLDKLHINPDRSLLSPMIATQMAISNLAATYVYENVDIESKMLPLFLSHPYYTRLLLQTVKVNSSMAVTLSDSEVFRLTFVNLVGKLNRGKAIDPEILELPTDPKIWAGESCLTSESNESSRPAGSSAQSGIRERSTSSTDGPSTGQVIEELPAIASDKVIAINEPSNDTKTYLKLLPPASTDDRFESFLSINFELITLTPFYSNLLLEFASHARITADIDLLSSKMPSINISELSIPLCKLSDISWAKNNNDPSLRWMVDLLLVILSECNVPTTCQVDARIYNLIFLAVTAVYVVDRRTRGLNVRHWLEVTGAMLEPLNSCVADELIVFYSRDIMETIKELTASFVMGLIYNK